MEHITLEHLKDKLEKKEIVGFIDTDNKKFRLFIADNLGYVCYFGKGKKRFGYRLDATHLFKFKKFLYPSTLTKEQKTFNVIHKYKTYAEKARFTNDWLDKCLELPDTFNDWVADGKKGLYEYGITTGNGIDGKVITIDGIAKEYSGIASEIRQAVSNCINYHSSRVRFRGYDMSIEIRYDEDTGEIRGWLSMEYKDCGNGYYYLLINNDAFIGYDVD